MENRSDVRVNPQYRPSGEREHASLPGAAVELGIWLSGIESFITGRGPADHPTARPGR